MAKAKKEETKVETKEVDVKEVVNTDSIKEEVMAYVDSQIDWRLEKVIGERVKKEIIEEVDKANRKVIREKNRKIFVKNIFLILFFGIICFLVYLLYQESYFDQFFNHSSKGSQNTIVEKEDKPKEEEEEKGPTLEEYIEQYGSYLDSYVLYHNSVYAEDFYNGKLTDEMMNSFAIQTLDFDQFTVEDDYHVIDTEDVLKACTKLFDKECSKKSFEYNGEKVRYFQKLDSYVTSNLLKKSEEEIIREIIDIQVDNDTVTITTIEGMDIDGVYYSVSPRDEVCEVYEGAFQEHQDSFNKVIYTFKDKKLVQVKRG